MSDKYNAHWFEVMAFIDDYIEDKFPTIPGIKSMFAEERQKLVYALYDLAPELTKIDIRTYVCRDGFRVFKSYNGEENIQEAVRLMLVSEVGKAHDKIIAEAIDADFESVRRIREFHLEEFGKFYATEDDDTDEDVEMDNSHSITQVLLAGEPISPVNHLTVAPPVSHVSPLLAFLK